jgi:hypothetical protein
MKFSRSLLVGFLIPGVLLLLVGAYRLGYFMSEDRSYGEDVVVIARFRQLEGALNEYYKDHGRYPPTRYQRDPREPLHSWRVLLLPYLNEDTWKGFNNYDFKKEWNDIENIRAIGDLAPLYFVSVEKQKFFTNILAVGPGDQWTEEGPLKAWVVKNGADSFVLFEKRDSKILWAKPAH